VFPAADIEFARGRVIYTAPRMHPIMMNIKRIRLIFT